jgi:hypothetical protein
MLWVLKWITCICIGYVEKVISFLNICQNQKGSVQFAVRNSFMKNARCSICSTNKSCLSSYLCLRSWKTPTLLFLTYVGRTARNEHSKIWRIRPIYSNERYRTISSIFHLQHERKISACAPLTTPSCTARIWLLPTCPFVSVLSNNFLWKR